MASPFEVKLNAGTAELMKLPLEEFAIRPKRRNLYRIWESDEFRNRLPTP